jgi:hypothetical protein
LHKRCRKHAHVEVDGSSGLNEPFSTLPVLGRALAHQFSNCRSSADGPSANRFLTSGKHLQGGQVRFGSAYKFF